MKTLNKILYFFNFQFTYKVYSQYIIDLYRENNNFAYIAPTLKTITLLSVGKLHQPFLDKIKKMINKTDYL